MESAQDLNSAETCTPHMGEHENMGPTEDYVGLKGATEVFSKAAKEGLYIVSAAIPIPDLKCEKGYMAKVEMGDSIDILVDGEEASKTIGERIARETGKPVGIARYEGLASLAHSNAQMAIDIAAHEGKSVVFYDETEDPIEAAARRFIEADQRL